MAQSAILEPRGCGALSVYAVLPVLDSVISGAHGPFYWQHEFVHALAYRSYALTDVDESRSVISYISWEIRQSVNL